VPGSAAASPGTGTAVPPPVGGGSTFDRIPELVQELQPSVVTIIREGGEGSGVVWSADGVIVTNNHVIEGVKQVDVKFADGTSVDGTVLASDPLSDLALVRADRTDLPVPAYSDTLPLVGSLALAMGNPLGFENSVTAGIVSGLNRAIPGAAQSSPALVDLIQTDAPISPGNSGGALVGPDGRIIGVNVAYIPPQAGSVSIGFAIPAPTVVDVVRQLQQDGTVDHAYLGIQPATLTPQVAAQFGLKATKGALVVGVAPSGPADRAGVKPGDVIVGIDDKAVETAEDLLGVLREHKAGDAVRLRISRDGQETDVEATLGNLES
jgi:S1-C subfamily serine protease